MSQHNWPPNEDDIVRLANDLLEKLHVSTRVKCLSEITSDIFVTLFEGLCAEQLPDLIHTTRCKEDEIHNCQAVIDALSLDILNTSLSHITGEDIVKKDRTAIYNLLDVFAGLFHYIVENISSDVSRGQISEISDADPDLVTPEFIDNILEKELRRTSHNTSFLSNSPGYNNLKSSNHSAERYRWARPSLAQSYSKTADLVTSSSIGHTNYRHNTMPVSSSQYRSAYKDIPNMEESTAVKSCSHGDLTADQLSHLALSIDQASKGVYGGSTKSLPTDAKKQSPKTGLASTAPPRTASRDTGPTRMTPSNLTTSASGMSASESHGTMNTGSILTSGGHLDNGPFDNLGKRDPKPIETLPHSPTVEDKTAQHDIHHKHTHYLYHYNGSEIIKPPIAKRTPVTPVSPRHLASSLPVSGSTSEKPSYRKAKSYESLQNLVRDTVEISRAAVNASPISPKHGLVDPAKRNAAASPKRSSSDRMKRNQAKITTGDKAKQTNIPSPRQSPRASCSQKYSSKKNVSFAKDSTASLYPKARHDEGTSKQRHSTVFPSGNSPSSEANATCQPIGTPETIKEYLLKYYGRDHIRSYSDTEVKTDSDENQSDEEFGYQYAACKRQLKEKAKKMVKFDEMLDELAPEEIGNLRKHIRNEEERTRLRVAFIDKMYEEDLNEHEDEVFDKLKEAKKKVKEVEKQYKNILKEPKKKTNSKGRYKTQASILTKKRNRSRSGVVHGRKRSLSSSPKVGRRNVTSISGSDLMPWLLEEFPHIHISPQTLHQMWNKTARQLEQLSKVEQEVKRKKSKAEAQIEEAERKQKILSEIMRKELKHNERLNDIKERRKQTMSVKAKIRERRLQSARCRKYYEEYHVRNRSRMLKKKSKEEMIFRRLFEDALNIQKERIRELHKYAREQRNKKAQQQQDHLESLENYYKDQYDILMETLAREREELEIRERAQTKVLNSLKRELQKKMEKEIREFQEQLYRDEDDAYFRQIDADRIKHQLNLARYQARI